LVRVLPSHLLPVGQHPISISGVKAHNGALWKSAAGAGTILPPMNETNHEHHHGKPDQGGGGPPGPYWKRAHHDWRFWFAAIMVLLAMTAFVMSDNEALQPRVLTQSPPPASTANR
jgi:hypothetical protein